MAITSRQSGDTIMTTDNRTVLVTGGNKGIGYEAVKLLSQQIPDGKVIMTTRTIKNGEDAIKKMQDSVKAHAFSNVSLLELDITDAKSRERAVAKVKADFGKLDVLIHNSGISEVNGDHNSSYILETNVQGAHDVILDFLPIIPKNGTIAVVSSEVGAWSMYGFNKDLQGRLNSPKDVTWSQIEDLSSDWVSFAQSKEHKEDWPELSPFTGGYCTSKALLTAWLRAFALEHKEVQVAIVCPGYCATELNHNSGPRPASQGGESISWPLFNKFESGQFYQDGKKLDFIMNIKDSPYASLLG